MGQHEYDPKPLYDTSEPHTPGPLFILYVAVAILYATGLAQLYINHNLKSHFREAIADEALSRKAGDEASLCITNAYVDGLYRKVQAMELQQSQATPEQFEQLKLWHKVGDAELQKRIDRLIQSQRSR